MDLETLRTRQEPLKQQYRESPETGPHSDCHRDLDQANLAINVPTHTGVARAGLHLAAGGDSTIASPATCYSKLSSAVPGDLRRFRSRWE